MEGWKIKNSYCNTEKIQLLLVTKKLEVIKIYNELNYTQNAEKNYINYELAIYGDSSSRIYDAMAHGILSFNDILWYQSFEGFAFLSQPAINLATELRRYIFRTVLNGKVIIDGDKTVFCISDEERYISLNDPDIIDKMTYCIHKYTPNISKTLIKNYLLSGNITRKKLIQIIFSLGATKEEFDKILSSGAFFRKLSPAIPNELIMLYCLDNGINDRIRIFKKFQSMSDKLIRDILENKEISVNQQENANDIKPDDPTPTGGDINLKGVSQEDFEKKFLIPCCISSAQKRDSEKKQYSVTARDLMFRSSVLQFLELEGRYRTLFYANPDKSVFVTDSVCAYIDKILHEDKKDYGLANVDEINSVMSQNLYCRFLNYRIMHPNSRKIYSMEYGSLPQQIKDNILTYPELRNIPEKAHRIDRHDILISFFYYFIMLHWQKNINSLIVTTPSEANQTWREFFRKANDLLRTAGYEEISFKNPLDALVRISLHSLNPLECYERIYELNVISSFSCENRNSSNYPPCERIKKVIASLKESYEKMLEHTLISRASAKRAYSFCENVSKACEKKSG